MSQSQKKTAKGRKEDATFEIFRELKKLCEENHIEMSVILEKLEAAMLKAAQKAYPRAEDDDFRIVLEPDNNVFQMWMKKSVIDGEPKTPYEIRFEYAKLIDPDCELGDLIEVPISPLEFGRTIAQIVKQSVRGDIRTINREQLLALFGDKEHQLITAVVRSIDPMTGAMTVVCDDMELILSRKEQMFREFEVREEEYGEILARMEKEPHLVPASEEVKREDVRPGVVMREYEAGRFKPNDYIKVYVSAIANKQKKPVVRISRVRGEFVGKLMEREIPEIQQGIVEIRCISREPGYRTKVAVSSNDPDVKSVGSCLGDSAMRIEQVRSELFGDEHIDIIDWTDDLAEFIIRALAPAEVLSVTIYEDDDQRSRKATVVVPDTKLSLAIGQKGHNAKLAAKLTGCKIDIKKESDVPAFRQSADAYDDEESYEEESFEDAGTGTYEDPDAEPGGEA